MAGISDELVAEFVSMMGAPPDEARGYLEMAGGNLEQAVHLYFEMGGGGGGGGSMPPASGAQTGAGLHDDVAAEVKAAAIAAGVDISDAGPPVEEEVRAPIAAYQDQMIDAAGERRRMQEAVAADAAAMERRMSWNAHEPPPESKMGSTGDAESKKSGAAINQLFSPPSYNEQAPYYEAVEVAKTEAKWLLVNIQQAEVFASHQLNRDVWSDDTIQELVTGSFVFWQRDDKSKEGEQFISYYKCGHQLPNICVIDPRTGRRVKSWEGRKWVESHVAAEFLFGFLDEFSMSRSPPAGSPNMSPAMSPVSRPEVADLEQEVRLVGLDDAANTEAPAEAPATPAEEPIAEAPEEPPESADCLKVGFKLPSGQRFTRRFLKDAPVKQMFVVASAMSSTPESRIDISTQFPKRSLRTDLEAGLETKMQDANVAGSQVLVTIRPS
eukprot:TRINITY_DN111573_c0_g1_i1.p1 TRINITY_DN111573_c0_g1~~TRINITY_DN111573_c0_g1_i1.p1  ORF type:complete len:439 (+),score=115.39 TRINITY_DN111573_c0_g1_i1:178-1494(+)